MSRLRVVLLTQGGLGVAVCRRLLELPEVELATVVFETPPRKRRGLMERIRRGVRYNGLAGTLLAPLRKLTKLRSSGPNGAGHTDLEVIRQLVPKTIVARDLHAPDLLDTLRSLNLDLGVVIGTTILKPALFEIPRQGMINLHQGQVPQYRGSGIGFWVLWDGVNQYGITVHKVVSAVDAGEILLTELLPFEYDYQKFGEDFEEFLERYLKSLDGPSVDLVIRSVQLIASGQARWQRQDLSQGFRRKKPPYREKLRLKQILRERFEGSGK
jgi:methionyl-tRNA formyltransferase